METLIKCTKGYSASKRTRNDRCGSFFHALVCQMIKSFLTHILLQTKLLRFCSDQFEVNGYYGKQWRPRGNTAQTTFHRGLHCILGQIRSPEKEMKYFLWNPSIYKMGRPDLTVQTLWTIPLIYNLVLIAHAQMPLINAHVNVSKVRYSMGYFDSENTGGITSESALFSMTL